MTDETLIAPLWFAAVPFVGFALLATLSVTLPQDDEGQGSLASRVWPAFPGLTLAFATVWCLLGNYEGDLVSLVLFSLTLVVSAIVCSQRDRIRALFARAGRAGRFARNIVCIAGIVVCSVLALELAWNELFPQLDGRGLLIELALVAAIQVALYFLGQRTGVLMAGGVILATIAGLSQSFLIKFKGVSLLPSDLYALSTAAAVSEGYSFVAGVQQLWDIMAAVAGLAFCSLLGPTRDASASSKPKATDYHTAGYHAVLLEEEEGEEEAPPRKRWKRPLQVLGNLALGAACSFLVWWGITGINYVRTFGITFEYWHTVECYKANGFLTSFVTAWQDFPIKRPKGYLKTRAVEAQDVLLQRYDAELGGSEQRAAATAQFDQDKPTVIVVMNETFSDLSLFDGLGCGYEGPTYFKSVNNALSRGSLGVSVLGGGTCNTEFEFLTGYSYAFVGASKYPYVTYDLAGCDSIARQLGDLGYATHAIHPNEPSNWDRDVVYDAMGFDQFHAIDEFEGAPELHMGVTDAATYDKIIELLTLDSRPQFIFDVTMQNHSSYNLGNIPSDMLVDYHPAGDVTAEDVAELNEYLSCIAASDRDLEAFMGKLSALDRKVVLVFFGDHQPAFTPTYNDLYFPDEDDVIHQERTHQSSYFIWANYDVAGNDQVSAADDASADLLGAMTLDLIGAPLTDMQKMRLASRLDIPAVNLFGYQGADRTWYAAYAKNDYDDTYRQVSWINYLAFGSKVQGQ